MNIPLVASQSTQPRVSLRSPTQLPRAQETAPPNDTKKHGVGAPSSGYALVGLVNQSRISAQRPIASEVNDVPVARSDTAASQRAYAQNVQQALASPPNSKPL